MPVYSNLRSRRDSRSFDKFPFASSLGYTGGKKIMREDINAALRDRLTLLVPLPVNNILPTHYMGHVLTGPLLNVGATNPDGLGQWYHYVRIFRLQITLSVTCS